MPPAHIEVWQSLQEPLRLKLGVEVYERWIAALVVGSESGSTLILGVANRFVLGWIDKRYLAAMETILREHCPGIHGIRLTIDPGLYQRARKERDALWKEGESKPDGGSPTPGSAPAEDVVAPAAGTVPGAGGEPPAAAAPSLPTVDSMAVAPRTGLAEREDQTLEGFVVGDCNRLAFNAVQEILDRPGRLYNPLFLFGPTGVGKTHLVKGLLKCFRERRRRPEPGRGLEGGGVFYKVAYITGEQFFQCYVASIQDRTVRQFQERYRRVDILIVDDIHLLVNKRKTQEEFLHTFSALGDAGRQVILTSDVPPRELRSLDSALVGRFSSGLVVGLKRPDYPTRLGIARSVAARLGMALDAAVVEHIATRMHGNAREIAGAVKQIHHRSRIEDGVLSAEAAMGILDEYIFEHSRRIDLPRIAEIVCAHFGLSPEALLGGGRQQQVASARQIAMYLARRYTRRSLAEIGKYFGNRNHSTVKCAEVKVSQLLGEPGSPVAKHVAAIVEALEE